MKHPRNSLSVWGLTLLALAGPAQAQFEYVTNNDAITITGYTGPGGAVSIPASTNGHPVVTIQGAFNGNALVTSVIIPHGVTNITGATFGACVSLTNVVLPDTLLSLGAQAFMQTSLGSVSLPASLNSLGAEAFGYCLQLQAINVDPANPVYTSPNGIVFSRDLKTLVEYPAGRPGGYILPQSVTNISSGAFWQSALSSVTIPATVAGVGANAFIGCNQLTAAYFAGSAPPDTGDQFSFDAAATVYHLDGAAGWGATFGGAPTASWSSRFAWTTNGDNTISITGYLSADPVLSVPPAVTGHTVSGLAPGAFATNSSLANAIIPAGVNFISATAFSNCVNLSSVTVPGNFANDYSSVGSFTFSFAYLPITNVTVAEGSTAIGDNVFNNAFLYPTYFATVNIPNSVTTIGNAAFRSCGISSITIPDSVTSISGIQTFARCFGLTNVILSTNLVSLANVAFGNCPSLPSITIPGSLSAVPAGAFVNCSGLTNVTLRNGVRDIGQDAFINCSSLPSISIPGSVTNIESIAFSGCGSLAQVYFQGNAPGPGTNTTVFSGTAAGARAFVLPGTTGWGALFDGLPVTLWNPQATGFDNSGGHFGFNITGPTNVTVVV